MRAHARRFSPLYEVWGSPKRGGGGDPDPPGPPPPPGSAPAVRLKLLYTLRDWLLMLKV